MLSPIARRSSPLARVPQVTFEEKIQEGADYRDGSQPPDVLPVWRNRCLYNVGRKLKRQAGKEPSRVADPDMANLLVRYLRIEHRPNTCEEGLYRSNSDVQQSHRLDDDNCSCRYKSKPFLHEFHLLPFRRNTVICWLLERADVKNHPCIAATLIPRRVTAGYGCQRDRKRNRGHLILVRLRDPPGPPWYSQSASKKARHGYEWFESPHLVPLREKDALIARLALADARIIA